MSTVDQSAGTSQPCVHTDQNTSVLFLTNWHTGLANIHLATAFALVEKHPSVKIHIASFSKLAAEVERMSAYATKSNNQTCKVIEWHQLTEIEYETSTDFFLGDGKRGTICPGRAGLSAMLAQIETVMAPWDKEAHWYLYGVISKLIVDVDPRVVVLDPSFQPAIDAARNLNRARAILSPNALIDSFVGSQPKAGMLWKYPLIGSGLPYPLPWFDIPTNVYLATRLALRFMMSRSFREKRSYLASKGVKDPLYFWESRSKDVPWITSSFPEAGIPLGSMPPQVVCCGPIVLDAAPAEMQDPELTSWLKVAPTMLINLGSMVKYDEQMARAMADSLLPVLESTDTQILWKFIKSGEYSDDFLTALEPYILARRVRLEKWLSVDPPSLLTTGSITLSVHHGGANSFYETVLGGIPHVVLPLWFDLYNFAATAEYLGVGVWPGKDTAPRWVAEVLSRSFIQVLVGEDGRTMRRKAEALGKVASTYHGRDTAAATIAKMVLGDCNRVYGTNGSQEQIG